MQIHATDLGTLVISQPSTELPPIRISLNVAVGGSLPAGGTVHQILRKSSSAPYDVEWSNDQDAQWGQVTGTITAQADLMALLAAKQSVSGMSNYLTLSQALAGYYPLNNPAGYITASAVDIFLTPSEASAIYQTQANMVSYITDAEAAIKLAPICYPRYGNPENYATESWVTGRGYATLSSPTFSGSVYVPALRNLLNTDLVIDSYNDNAAGTHYLHKFTPFDGKFVLAPNGGGLTFPDGTTQVTTALPLSGGTMTGNITFDGTSGQFIGKGQFDTSRGGNYGISLVCSIGYEFNWQAGWLTTTNQGSSTARPLYLDSYAGTTLRAWNSTNDTGTEVSFSGVLVNTTDGTNANLGPGGVDITGPTDPLHDPAVAHLKVDGLEFRLMDDVPAATYASTGITFPDSTMQTTSALPLSGGTITGKLVTTQTATTAPLNIGFLASVPTTTVAGDVWIGDNLNFKDKNGTSKLVVNANTQNTFSQPQVIAPPSTATLPALRITNTAAVNSFVVEDEANPDSTPFIIGPDGRVGIHGTPASNAIHKLAIYNGNAVFSSGYGIAFGDGTIQTTAATTFNPAGYAQLSGATFTGKVNLTSAVNAASLNLDAGIIPTTTVAGDMWIADNLNFKNSTGTLRTIANLNTENTFDKPQVISTGTAATTAALRITNQSLTADSLIVEDTTNPDATAFVINNQGKVGIGVAPDANAALKIDSNGMSFNGLIVKPTSVANSPFTNGQMAHSEYPKELRITINGVQYAIPMRVI